jgi:hypothetical protein
MLVCHLAYTIVMARLTHIYYAAIYLLDGFKEPDSQIFPTTRRPNDPTLVLEVGYSECMNDLRQDARRWLSKTPPVRFSV